MKRPFAMFAALMCLACGSTTSDSTADETTVTASTNFRAEMRTLVQGISAYAKGIRAGFIIIPQNGHALLTEDGTSTGAVASSYISAIDAVGREDLLYGFESDNTATKTTESDAMIAFMNIARSNNLVVLVTDYCSTPSFVDDSYVRNNTNTYLSFAADQRELNTIPTYPATPYNVTASNIDSLASAHSFLYLLNTDAYTSKAGFISAVNSTKYDVVITDRSFQGSDALSASDVTSLKTKANGGTRLVIAYMSIGEAENYRSYWQSAWTAAPPTWLKSENSDWPGNFKVEYWNQDWQAIIFGNDTSYLKAIIDAGFDGVYLDIIDAYEYFEGS